MRPVTSLPGTVVRALHCHRAACGVFDGGRAIGWGEIGVTARLLALGLSAHGVSASDRVAADPAPSSLAVAAELAALAIGATVVVGGARSSANGDGSAPTGRATWQWTTGGLRGPSGIEPVGRLLAAGRHLDDARPDRFEGLLDAVDPSAPAFEFTGADGGPRTLDHPAVLDLLHSLDLAMGPAVDARDDDRPLSLTVAGDDWGMAQRLLGIWWPARQGAMTSFAASGGLAAVVAHARPTVIVAPGPAWADLAEAIRAHPRLAAGGPPGRLLLRLGRAAVAGERVGRAGRLGRRAVAAALVPGIADDLGLGDVRMGVALSPPAEGDRRDLLAIGLPLAVAWVPDGAPAPVTMTVAGRSDRSAGQPMPGWSVAVEDGGRVVVSGPGVPGLDSGRRGQLDEGKRLWVRGMR